MMDWEYDDGLFQWDERKAERNLGKHGVSFSEAKTVFRDREAVTFLNTLHSDDEERWITVGFSERGRMLTVVTTDRGQKIRIISARTVERNERKSYETRRT